jgi:ribosomal protein L11 methyltransferase
MSRFGFFLRVTYAKLDMKWIEAKVRFDHAEPDLAADLVAAVFFDLDLQGVVIEDPLLAADADLAEDAIAIPGAHAVVGYFAGDRRGEWIADQLVQKLDRLKETTGMICRVSYRQVDDRNWAEAWKAHFRPQRIGKHLVVKPSWRDYRFETGDLVIELDPGMAFGTGTHPTTALCLALIERHLQPGADVLDIGTGSGILMIAAARLGAGSVHGLDKDELAVDVAAENLRRNRIEPQHWSVCCGDLVHTVKGAYHLIVANILAPVIIELLDDLDRVLASDGLFICSGIIRASKDSVLEKMHACGFRPLEIRDREGWTAIVAKRK